MTERDVTQHTLRRLRAMAHHRSEELRDVLRGLVVRLMRHHGGRAAHIPVSRTTLDMEPSTTFEALLRQQMQALEQQMRDVKGRINSLFLLIAGTVALQAILRVAGL